MTANLAKATVRIKRAQPETVVYLLNGYATYEDDEQHPEVTGNTRLPWAMVPGKVVWEKELPTTVELDHSERFGFNWDEALGGKRKPGIYFVNVEGQAKEAVQSNTTLGAQGGSAVVRHRLGLEKGRRRSAGLCVFPLNRSAAGGGDAADVYEENECWKTSKLEPMAR